MTSQLDDEINAADSELEKLKAEIASFLTPQPNSSRPKRRGAALAAAAVASVGFFGSGIVLGNDQKLCNRRDLWIMSTKK